MATAYVNAAIYTADPAHPWATMLVERDGIIIAVGDDAEAANAVAAADEIVDLGGRMVMPGGVRDAHTHLISGLNRWEESFAPDAGEAEILEALRA